MMRIFLLIPLLLILSSCSTGSRVILNDAIFEVELASTPDSRALGLMYRESLNENNGMLFIFNDESERSFWMKNTKIPLDMIFMDKNKRIVNIITAMPCKQEPCINYNSKKPAMYVLEINANEAAKNNLKMGDVAELEIGFQ